MARGKRKTMKVTSVSAAVEVGKDAGEPLAEDEDDRGSWGNQCEFILSCLGFAVGFGNVWRFPYLCYKNGGAVFLIPYLIMLVCAGLPMFFLELALGQYVGLSPACLFPALSPIFSGIGLAMPVVAAWVSIYFDVIIAWSFYYVFASFTAELPWASCHHDYNTPQCASVDDVQSCGNDTYYYDTECLDIVDMCAIGGYVPSDTGTDCVENENSTDIISVGVAVHRISSSEDFYRNRVMGVQDSTWEDQGTMQWKLVGCLALGWIMVGFGLMRGVKSSGKAIYFTALFPYVVLTILLGFGLTLEGAYEGIEFYILKVDFSKLSEPQVWTDAASQLFFSLGTSFGSLITLASYNKFSNNCMRDAIIISCCNCATSVYAGFAIFSILGYLANQLDVPVSEVVTSGSGLAFIAYPQAVLSMPPPQLWSILFFVMFITIGLSSEFAMVETVNSALYDMWPELRQRKPYVVMCVCSAMFLCGLPMCLQGGAFLFELFNLYAAGLSVILLAIVETLVVNYVYGNKKFFRHIEKEIGIWIPMPLRFYWLIMWMFITPVSLFFMLVMSLINWVPAAYGDYVLPPSAQGVGWFLMVSSVMFIPGAAIYVLVKGEYKGKDLYRSTDQMCTARQRHRVHKQRVERFIYTNWVFVTETYMKEGSHPISLPTHAEDDANAGLKHLTTF